MTTTVINLYGGAGVGKSTAAALLFAHMKMRGCSTELVREYVKLWAWSGRKVREHDQLYLLGKQSAYESMLYGKVEYIVTDSPVFLAGAYAEWYNGEAGRYVMDAANQYISKVEKPGSGVVIRNYYLTREKPYDPRGRWGTEADAKLFDAFLLESLVKHDHPFVTIAGSEESRIKTIMNDLGICTYSPEVCQLKCNER